MKIRFFCIIALLMAVSTFSVAQTSHYGFSLRLGIKTVEDFAVNLSSDDLTRITQRNDPAFNYSLRYNHFFGERFGAYAGYGFTKAGSSLAFRTDTESSRGRRDFFTSISMQHSVAHWEAGISYAQPIVYRLSFVGEAGLQFVKVKRGGGSGRVSISEGETMAFFGSSMDSFDKNVDESRGFALQLSPGLRYQFADHFYLTVRTDFVLSEEKLIENGMIEIETNLTPEPVTGTFDRKYNGQGIDLMITYRF